MRNDSFLLWGLEKQIFEDITVTSEKKDAFEKFISFFYHFYLENIEIASDIINVYYQRQVEYVI